MTDASDDLPEERRLYSFGALTVVNPSGRLLYIVGASIGTEYRLRSYTPPRWWQLGRRWRERRIVRRINQQMTERWGA